MEIELPETPGVYIFKDESGQPLYVGKSINIKKRVENHFRLKSAGFKQKNLISKTHDVEAIEVDSDIEALLLEANLIKKYKPFFNSQLKDDKDYLYIKITKDTFPRILTARKRDIGGSKIYFGPFPSATRVRSTLKSLRKIFPYSTCKPPTGQTENKKRPCLAFHIGLCPGVCAGRISEREYKRNIGQLIAFFQGKKYKVLSDLEKEIVAYSKTLQFEKASDVQRRIEAFEYITKSVRDIDEYLDFDTESIRSKELADLAEKIGIEGSPRRIEGYDISNISGENATGSMVVFSDGKADKDEYRRFKIKTVKGINDTGMLSEVLNRRFKNKWDKPDLIVVDGGRGQLNAALKVLQNQSIDIQVIALAKKFEEIYIPNRRGPLRLPRNSSALKLIQRLRDEAHRFAISYHRNLRKKQFLTNA